jgi:hypothetical protein
MNQATYEGRPINVATDKLVVMVGDGILYNLLRNILSTDLIATTNAAFGGASGIEMRTKNWVAANIVPVYAPELRNIVTSNLSTSWWIFAQPETRPVVEIGFLSGFQSPQLYRKLPNTVRVGGGSADELGDFEIMGTEFKGLTVFGGTRMDARSTVASDGTSS